MIYYISIDPGKRSGITWYNEKANILGMETVLYDNLSSFLDKFNTVKLAVVEEYRVYPHKARQHVYSDLMTPRAIGRIESWAEHNNIKLVKQGAHIMDTGYRYLGKRKPPKSDPLNHVSNAHAHFVYYAVCNGLIDPTKLLEG